jgi:WD40 repeat protein
VSRLVYSPDNSILVSGDGGGTIILWDTSSWQPMKTLEFQKELIFSLKFCPNSRLLFSGGKDNIILIYDLHQNKIKQEIKDHNGWVTSLFLSRD